MKERIELEYSLNSASKVLFDHLSTPSGLSHWFADNVNVDGKDFIFIWNDSKERAKVLTKRPGKFIRFQWEEDFDNGEEEYFFEFKVVRDEITGVSSLLVTDFVETDDIDEAIDLWDSQIAELKRFLGI
ncbi:MAG: hypothetical protein J7L46_01190 [Bacteroidales bacterium]|nr:hypothetical protein [Bacteroidales bacterium]